MTMNRTNDAAGWQKCRALLFDKDGTIINFRLLWLGWCREVVQTLGPGYGSAEVEKSLSAWGVDLALGSIDPGGLLAIGSRQDLQQSLAEKLMEESRLPEEKMRSDLSGAIEQAYDAVEKKGLVQPIEGVSAVITELYRQGYKLAIVTTDDTQKAEDNLKMIGLDRYFQVVLGCDRVVHCKPAPDLVLEACRQLDLSPGEAAVIGDTVADMKMSKAAGAAFSLAVASGVTTPGRLSEFADMVIESVAFMVSR